MHHVDSSCQIYVNRAFKSSVFSWTVLRWALFSIVVNVWLICVTISVNLAFLYKCHNCNDSSWFILLAPVNHENMDLPHTGVSWRQFLIITTEKPANSNIEKISDNLTSISVQRSLDTMDIFKFIRNRICFKFITVCLAYILFLEKCLWHVHKRILSLKMSLDDVGPSFSIQGFTYIFLFPFWFLDYYGFSFS